MLTPLRWLTVSLLKLITLLLVAGAAAGPVQPAASTPAAEAATPADPSPAEPSRRLRIVLLFGTPDVTLWAQQFTEAFFRSPSVRGGDPPVSVTTEFHNLYRADVEGLAGIVALLRYKQRIDPADVVVAVQGPAATFLARHGQQIYPGAERLYVLPGQDVQNGLGEQARTHVIPTAMGTAIARTAQLIPRLMPRVERILVISGANELDRIYDRHARTELAALDGLPAIEYLHARPLAEVRQRLREAPKNTAALMLTFEGDPAGNVYRNSIDVTPRLARISAIPIFAAYDTLLGTGVVGGTMTSTSRYGQAAGDVAMALAAGQANLNPDPGPPLRTAFDGAALARYGLSRSLLPEDSELINDTEPAYVAYAGQIAVAIAVMVVQLALILALLRLLRQRKLAAAALDAQARDLERRTVQFESVVNSVPDALVITDGAGIVVHANRHGFRSTFGFAPEGVIGRHVDSLSASGALPPFSGTDAEPAREHDFKAADGRTFPGEWAATRILTETGEHLGYVLVIRDISERVAVEEERRHAHKMEALGGLAGGIAHDFNNVLAVMLGNAELLQAGDADVADASAQIIRAGTRARDLVRQILTFSRKGRDNAGFAAVDIRNLILESMRFLEASLPSSIQVHLDMDDSFDAQVLGNGAQLQQVVMNLALNARDAIGPAGGELRIQARILGAERRRVVSHGVTPGGPQVCIEVIDTGPGMSSDLQRRAFEPFFTTKGPGEGTGMGLALVYGIVDAHGGAIDVQSSHGAGTGISVFLPLAVAGAAEPAAESTEMRPSPGGRVLLVEDEEAVRNMTATMLEQLGYQSDAFDASDRALEAWSSAPGRYQAVITDLTMPGINGLELIGRLRDAGAVLPIVLTSGFSEPLAAESRRALAPLAILPKPYRIADLARALNNLLAPEEAVTASERQPASGG